MLLQSPGRSLSAAKAKALRAAKAKTRAVASTWLAGSWLGKEENEEEQKLETTVAFKGM